MLSPNVFKCLFACALLLRKLFLWHVELKERERLGKYYINFKGLPYCYYVGKGIVKMALFALAVMWTALIPVMIIFIHQHNVVENKTKICTTVTGL